MTESSRPTHRPLAIAGIVVLFVLLGAGALAVLTMVGTVSLPLLLLDSPAEPTVEGDGQRPGEARRSGAGAERGEATAGSPADVEVPPGDRDGSPGGLVDTRGNGPGIQQGDAQRPAGPVSGASGALSAEQRRGFLDQSNEVMDRYEATAAQMQEDYERDVARLMAESELAVDRIEHGEDIEDEFLAKDGVDPTPPDDP